MQDLYQFINLLKENNTHKIKAFLSTHPNIETKNILTLMCESIMNSAYYCKENSSSPSELNYTIGDYRLHVKIGKKHDKDKTNDYAILTHYESEDTKAFNNIKQGVQAFIICIGMFICYEFGMKPFEQDDIMRFMGLLNTSNLKLTERYIQSR